MSSSRTASAEMCLLQSPVFGKLGPVTFRRAESDAAPVMEVSLGDRVAVMPLGAFQREFAIADASPDGRMLRLIAESLSFVTALQIGDELPSEVLTGQASWDPAAKHQRRAAARLRAGLLAWADPTVGDTEAIDLDRLESDPRLRAGVQAAFEQAAAALNLPEPKAVMAVLADVAAELAYIEALRETLLARVQAVAGQIAALSGAGQVNSERQTTLLQVRRLIRLALQTIGGRFAEVDAQTGEVLATLRNADSHRNFIRAHRDWLYCSRRAWEPTLADWAAAAPVLDESTWPRLGRTYHFLAPRFMPVQEWTSVLSNRTARGRAQPERVMLW
jgi:hypothetical protein